jgi:hypothetical protein
MRLRTIWIAAISAGCGLCLALVIAGPVAAQLKQGHGRNRTDLINDVPPETAQKPPGRVGRYQGQLDSDNCPWLFDTATGECWQANVGEFAKPPEGVEWRKVARAVPQPK